MGIARSLQALELSATLTDRHYRFGRLDERTRTFQPASVSGDTAIMESEPLLGARARHELDNNAIFSRCRQALVDLIVGTGIQTFADPVLPTDDLQDTDNLLTNITYGVESDDAFMRWAEDPKQVDIAGKLAWPDMQRMILAENVGVGSCLLLEVANRRSTTGFSYQLIERDQLDTSQDRQRAPGQNAIVGGVELDAHNAEVAYYVYDAHPYDHFASNTHQSKRILAHRAHHIYSLKRPSQNVGITWLTAIGQTTLDRDRFISNELATAVKCALLAVLSKSSGRNALNLTRPGDVATTDDTGNPAVALGMSPLAIQVGPQDSVEVIESDRPSPNAESFLGVTDHDIAAGSGVSYYTLTGRMEKTNYTGFRGAQQIEDMGIRPIQNWLCRTLCLPVRRRFNELAVSMQLIRSVKPAALAREPQRYDRYDGIGPGREMLDPENETEAMIGRLRSSTSTLKIEAARRGQHWYRLLVQRARENAVADALGLVLDFSKGQGGQVERSTSLARDEESA